MNEKIRCILIDDEIDALDGFEILLNAIGNIDVVEKINNSEIAIEAIQNKKPDIVFLDIDMPVKNGFEVLEDINSLKIDTKVVFVTAFDQYILKALRNSAFDYLTKPVDRLELKEVINRTKNKETKIEHINLDTLKMIKIPINHGCIFLKKDDIIYCEADGNYSKIITIDDIAVSSQNLGKFETIFANDNFLRISKSLLINTKYLTKFDKKNRICTLKFEDETYNLTVSRRNLNLFEGI